MLARLERYLEGKKLELNVRKTKVMWFGRGGGRRKRWEWRWKGEKIEEVRVFDYLGYRMQRNDGQEEHVKERVRKATVIMGRVWGIRKRRFERDWERRIWLFDKLVWTVLSYGIEIWGRWEREGVERLQERLLRWGLQGVEWNTPGYMVREELQRVKLRGERGKENLGF